MPETFSLTTVLDAPALRVWEQVQTPRLLHYVAAPLVAFVPLDPPMWPERWEEREYVCAVRMLGVFPAGKQQIVIRYAPAGSEEKGYELIDDGRGDLALRWHHRILVEPSPGGQTRYTDHVEIEAGHLTPLVVAFARMFYRHRQRRWRRLVATHFRYPGASSPLA